VVASELWDIEEEERMSKAGYVECEMADWVSWAAALRVEFDFRLASEE